MGLLQLLQLFSARCIYSLRFEVLDGHGSGHGELLLSSPGRTFTWALRMSCLSPLSRKASFKRHHLGCGLTWRPSVSPSTSTMPKPRSPPPLLFSWEALHPSPHPPLSLLLLFFLPLDCCRIKPIRNCFSAKRQRYSYVPAWESGFVPPQPAPPRPSLTLRISLHQTLASQRIRLECGFVQMGSGVNFAGKPRAERR